MSHLVPIKIRVEKNIVTRVLRIMRGQGQLTVKVGQEVTPEEIIGRAAIASGFRTINLSRELEVTPHETEKYLTKTLGQRIYKGELLAFKDKGFLKSKKVVTAPTDGTLDFLNTKTGELKIVFFPKQVNLPAGVYGIVEKIDKDKGQIVIRTQVSRIHGVFGSGGLREGILHVLGKKDDLPTKSAIQSKYSEHILIGGSLFFKETISAAISQGVSGLVSGGITASDYRSMAGGRLVFPRKINNDIGISIVISEGFGSIPIGEDIFDMLSEYDGKFVFLDGNKALISLPSFSSSSMTAVRSTHLPEIESDKSICPVELKVGQRVQVIGNSYFGEQGKVVAINDTATLLPSKIRTILVTVETSRRKIQVPVANLEVVV